MKTLVEKKESNLVGISINSTIIIVNRRSSDYCRALARRERSEVSLLTDAINTTHCNNVNVKIQTLITTNKRAANTLLLALARNNK